MNPLKQLHYAAGVPAGLPCLAHTWHRRLQSLTCSKIDLLNMPQPQQAAPYLCISAGGSAFSRSQHPAARRRRRRSGGGAVHCSPCSRPRSFPLAAVCHREPSRVCERNATAQTHRGGRLRTQVSASATQNSCWCGWERREAAGSAARSCQRAAAALLSPPLCAALWLRQTLPAACPTVQRLQGLNNL